MTEQEKQERHRRRMQPTQLVLAELQRDCPEAWEAARVVGSWVWVQFADKPPGAVRDKLRALGFHWNRRRQSWQHPCGKFSGPSKADPRYTYGQIPAADAVDELAPAGVEG